MAKILIYEAEPGDWRFDTEPWGYYIEVTDEELAELKHMDEARRKLNKRLAELKEREVSEWD